MGAISRDPHRSHSGQMELVPAASGKFGTADSDVAQTSFILLLIARFIATIEVAVSKFFPGGFMWQLGSVLTVYAGFGDNSFLQFLLTGLGDASGVLIGHCLWYAFRRYVLRSPNDGWQVFQVGLVLASASFVSGFVWQPSLNIPKNNWQVGFWGCSAITGAVCGLGFFCALRVSRTLLPMMFGLKRYMELPKASVVADAFLGLGVFGSSFLFVSTNNTFDDDPFESFLGITDDISFLGMVRAGMSTSIGFTVVLVLQNLVLLPGTHWLDGPDAASTHTPWWWMCAGTEAKTKPTPLDDKVTALLDDVSPA